MYMDSKRMKVAAEWFYRTIFQDEHIQPRKTSSQAKLPPCFVQPVLWKTVSIAPGSPGRLSF